MTQYVIPYQVDGLKCEGVLAVPEAADAARLPGLIMAPNWLGITGDAKGRAEMWASWGFIVFVPDLYGVAVRPRDFSEAAAAADPLRLDAPTHRRRMTQALAVLNDEGERRDILVPRLRAAVGYCFGGGNVLELVRTGAEIQAAIAIHGDLVTEQPAVSGEIKAAILALHGSADPVVPKEHRDQFEAEMTAAGARWQLTVFGGVLHAFTDVGADFPPVARYDADATETSYAMARQFIATAFNKI